MARLIDSIITKVNGQYGAPLGRANKGTAPASGKIHDSRVPMHDSAYDKGGVYWGIGKPMRVRYSHDLSYIEFYREGEKEFKKVN